MRPLALTACLVLSAGLAAVPAMAQDAKPAAPAAPAPSQDGLPAAEQLFQKYVAAIGGPDAFKEDKNRVTKGDIAVVGQPTKGSIVTYRVSPNKSYAVFELPGIVTNETWCDGVSGWQRNSNTGTKKLEGMDLTQALRDADFMGEANYKNRYREMKTLEKTTFSEQPAYAVLVTPPEGDSRTFYFDTDKGYLIGIKFKDPGGNEWTTTLSDYKQFGKALHPTRIVQKSSRTEAIRTITSIEVNVPNMPSTDAPEEVKKAK